MLDYCFEPNTKNKKWIWMILFAVTVALILFCLYRKRSKKKKDADEEFGDYLTLGEESVDCCEMEKATVKMNEND